MELPEELRADIFGLVAADETINAMPATCNLSSSIAQEQRKQEQDVGARAQCY